MSFQELQFLLVSHVGCSVISTFLSKFDEGRTLLFHGRHDGSNIRSSIQIHIYVFVTNGVWGFNKLDEWSLYGQSPRD